MDEALKMWNKQNKKQIAVKTGGLLGICTNKIDFLGAIRYNKFAYCQLGGE